MLVKKVYAVHDLHKRWLVRCRATILVMKLLRSVNGHTHKKVVVFEKLAPLVCEQRAVGLYAVVDLSSASVDALQLQCSLVERDGAHEGLTSVPCEEHLWCGLCLNIFFYKLFEQLVRDDMVLTLLIELVFFKIIAIFAP